MLEPRNRGACLLEAWRRNKGLTQFRAAVILDMDPSPYSKFEGGKRKPGRAAALRIAERTDGAVPFDAWDEEGNAVEAAG